MMAERAESHLLSTCTVRRPSGYEVPSRSRCAGGSRCSALTWRSASSGTDLPVSATSAATAAVRSDVAALDPLGRGGEAAVCQVTDELVDGGAGGLAGRGCHKPGA